jgi:hypothetical protein
MAGSRRGIEVSVMTLLLDAADSSSSEALLLVACGPAFLIVSVAAHPLSSARSVLLWCANEWHHVSILVRSMLL